MLQVNFIIISIIHKILVLLKMTRFLKLYNKLKSKLFFSQHIMMESLSLEEVIRDVRDLFILKKEVDDAAIKDAKNLFRLKKKIK